jgi:hypothetical protein
MERTLKGTQECALNEQLSFIYRLQLYAIFTNGKMLLIDSDLQYKGAL